MISKVLGLALLVAYTKALHNDHHNTPTSFVSFNDNHNTVQHIQSAPQQYSSPKFAPQLHSASYNTPSLSSHQANTYYSSNVSPSSHFAPATKAVAQFAPIPQQVASFSQKLAPSQYSQQASLNLSPSSHYVAPATHTSAQFAPISHQAAPFYQKAAPALQQVVPFAHKVVPASYAHAAPAYHEEHYAPAQYEFHYGVQDHHTGDIHSHQESRQGDKTQGEYSLHEADGTIRTVRYNVEGHSGFNAVVERSGHPQAQAHQPIKALVAAPHQQYHH